MKFIKIIYQISEIGRKKIFLIFFLPILFACLEGIGVGMLYEILIFVENSRLVDGSLIKESYLESYFNKMNIDYSIFNIFLIATLPILLRFVIDYRKLTFFSQLEFNFQYKLRRYIYEKYLKSNLIFFIDHSHGSLSSSIGIEVKEGAMILRSGAELLGNIFLGIIYLFIVFFISYKLSFISILIFLFSALIFKVFSKNLKQISKNASGALRNLNQDFQEFLYSTRLVKARRIEDFYKEKIINTSKKVEQAWIGLAKKNHFIYSFTNPFLILGVFFILFYGVQFMKLSLSELGIFLLILNKISNLVIKSNSNILNVIQCGEILKKIFELTKKSESYIEKFTGKEKISKLRDSIKFENVEFSYSNSEVVLKNVNFRIKKFEKVLIMGESGSGKSTLIDLILQLQKIKKGKITIDGLDIKNIQIDHYRKLFGYVPQTANFFFGTLKDNLIYGLKDVRNEDIINALKIADCLSFVNKLPNKLNTNLGELGLTLSGGQRQRISIARALLDNPEILILDEPTSSLDPISEKEIKVTLNKLQKRMTLIIISHSKTLINKNDKIIYLSDGNTFNEIHQNLLKTNKKYLSFIKS
tara:strand:+ start:321 stop:2078 length:1758 start_codon:yes stop_codon:yes gene_type:complete